MILWKLSVAASALVLVSLASLAGCGGGDDDDEVDVGRGETGDSCTRSADCGAGLRCIGNVCGAATPASDGGAVGLGGEGEDCGSRSDCAPELGCFEGRCTSAPGVGPRLGKRGETCQVPSDCEAGLTCVNVATNGGFGTTVQSICDVADYPFEPTGKTCSSECRAASDCCQLPTTVHENDVRSCAALDSVLSGVDCATTLDEEQLRRCFNRTVYCQCNPMPWTCDAGRCTYAAACTTNGSQRGGCPGRSRANFGLTTSCNVATGKCGVPVATCASDAACVTLPVTDDPFDTCTAGECTCYQGTSCLRRCADDLDCAAGTTCDPTSHVCLDAAQCDTDARCAQLTGDVTARCSEGKCRVPCTSDQQCGGSGVGPGFFSGTVCAPTGFCEPLGCGSDAECTGNGGVRLFCDTPPAATAANLAHSAITSGL